VAGGELRFGDLGGFDEPPVNLNSSVGGPGDGHSRECGNDADKQRAPDVTSVHQNSVRIVGHSTQDVVGRWFLPRLQWTHIRGRPGFDVVGSPAELQAEVAGWPRKSTGNKASAKNDLALAA
jgi:hypothetical protein